jgi:hypothetical protein
MHQEGHFQLLVFVECTAMAYDFQVSLVNNLSRARVQHIQAKVMVDMVDLVKALEHTNLGLV